MRGAVKTVVVPMRNRWTWPLAMILGLVISSVFTGLSVGLPLGLACCTSSSTYTEYDGYQGAVTIQGTVISGSFLYRFSIDQSTNSILDQCKALCNADSACAYFDYTYAGEFATFCSLYSANQISEIKSSSNPDYPFNVYIKNGYSFPSSS